MSSVFQSGVSSKTSIRRVIVAAATALTLCGAASVRATTLADQPVFASADVPGNLALTLSVEFPTAISVANLGDYADSSTYLGYFDPAKCYNYLYNSTTPASSYFRPAAMGSGTYGHQCSGQWSGNFMNWATMQTIDPFRWALTGGYRSVDSASQTILEKAWGSTQGSTSNFPYRGTGQPTGHNMPSSSVAQVTPFSSWTNWLGSIWGNGNALYFFGASLNNGSGGDYTGGTTSDQNTLYRLFVRVSVCDYTGPLGYAGLESNCQGYGSSTVVGGVTRYTVYKPEGLMQKYSNKIRYGTLSYLNTLGIYRQGGVLREAMGFIGPTYPTPLSSAVNTNPLAEWSATTGQMTQNPDAASAGLSGVSASGNMNYLNKFGESAQTYETYDNVGELYYAAVRYFENLGNVPEWTNSASATELDGFPAITTWVDPILYRCQKNFILGIGDDHTWTDYNTANSQYEGSGVVAARPIPGAVSSDTFNKTQTWLTALQNLEGITPTGWWNSGMGSTPNIAGLAYGAHVLDIRSDLADTQTISTYWMDVAEYQEVENLNPYYLATKYGGFNVPSGYSITNTTALPLSEYDTSGNNITMNGGNVHPLPDNYFEAGSAAAMVSSLTSAFSNIANAIKPFTTSFSVANPNVQSGELSFGSYYQSANWTDVITASTLTFPSGTPTLTPVWVTTSTMETQLAGTGWQTGGTNGRNVVTWSGTAGVAFQPGTLPTAELSALLPSSYSSSSTTTQYLNYLRGDRTNEVGSTVTGSTKSLRARALLLGDIVDANLAPVSVPSMSYSDANDPGYAAFKSSYAARPTMLYAAANDGMVHAFVGSTGIEQWAYVPSPLYQGPNNTPQVDGLAALGNPNFAHHYYVDATPGTFDLDLGHAGGTFGSANWATLLIGGLGKGGRSFYAIDVTNPAGMTTETAVAGKVKWEFTDSTMGYTYGYPVVVKTAKYGWVVALTSGYNNSDGYGYLYLVNPVNGTLLQKIKTPSTSSGLTQAAAYVQDYTDFTADSIYVGDLNGQLWRFDLTGSPSAYPAPTLLATLTDASSNPQPVTTAPEIEIHPTTRERYVMVGTGELLSSSDIGSTPQQTFYAIIDGTAGGFAAVATPYTRSSLTQVTDVTAGVTVPNTSHGWYYDLNSGYRIVANPVSYNGNVAFSALTISTDPCSPSGQSEIYAINFATGKSVLNSTTGVVTDPPAPYVAYTNAVTTLAFVNANNTPELVAGVTTGVLSQVGANLTGTIATRLLNWREIPTAQ